MKSLLCMIAAVVLAVVVFVPPASACPAALNVAPQVGYYTYAAPLQVQAFNVAPQVAYYAAPVQAQVQYVQQFQNVGHVQRVRRVERVEVQRVEVQRVEVRHAPRVQRSVTRTVIR